MVSLNTNRPKSQTWRKLGWIFLEAGSPVEWWHIDGTGAAHLGFEYRSVKRRTGHTASQMVNMHSANTVEPLLRDQLLSPLQQGSRTYLSVSTYKVYTANLTILRTNERVTAKTCSNPPLPFLLLSNRARKMEKRNWITVWISFPRRVEIFGV